MQRQRRVLIRQSFTLSNERTDGISVEISLRTEAYKDSAVQRMITASRQARRVNTTNFSRFRRYQWLTTGHYRSVRSAVVRF